MTDDKEMNWKNYFFLSFMGLFALAFETLNLF